MKTKPQDVEYVSTEDAARVLNTLDPDFGWTFRKLKDRIDRTKEVQPQKVGQALVFTRRQLARYVRIGYREWPKAWVSETAYGIDAAAQVLGGWLNETITHRQMEYLIAVKRRIHPVKIGRTLVFSRAELRRFERAEKARRRDRLVEDA